MHYALPSLFTLSKPGNITRRPCPNNTAPPDLPSRGNLVAIETEFVFVQHERSTLTSKGSKVTVTKGRSVLAWVSAIDCWQVWVLSVIIDNYVLLTDPVVNYLRQHLEIIQEDLDLVQSSRHLVTMRAA